MTSEFMRDLLTVDTCDRYLALLRDNDQHHDHHDDQNGHDVVWKEKWYGN